MRTTKSMHSAAETLGLEHLFLVHAGAETFALGPNMSAVALGRIHSDLSPI